MNFQSLESQEFFCDNKDDGDHTYEVKEEGMQPQSSHNENGAVIHTLAEELSVDQSHLLSLLRCMLEAPIQTEQETEAIEAGCVLWDMSNSLAIAQYLCENALFLVTEKLLNDAQHSARLLEVACGILGNVASISPALCHSLGCEEGLAIAVIGLLFTSFDPPTLGEALRVLTAGCSLTTSVWRARFDDEVCARAVYLLANALNSQLQQRLCEFFFALIFYVDETEEAKRDLIVILEPTVFLRCVSDIIVTCASSSSASSSSAPPIYVPSDEVLDLCLKLFHSLLALDPRCALPIDIPLCLYRIISHTASESCKISACCALVCYLSNDDESSRVSIPVKYLFLLWDCVSLFAAELPYDVALQILYHVLLTVFKESPSVTNSSSSSSSSIGVSVSQDTLPAWFTKIVHSIVKGTDIIQILQNKTSTTCGEVIRLLKILLHSNVVVLHCGQFNRSKRLLSLTTFIDNLVQQQNPHA